MKFNLKNRPEIPDACEFDYADHYEWVKWFEGFEKELRERLKQFRAPGCTADCCRPWDCDEFIEEILGETSGETT